MPWQKSASVPFDTQLQLLQPLSCTGQPGHQLSQHINVIMKEIWFPSVQQPSRTPAQLEVLPPQQSAVYLHPLSKHLQVSRSESMRKTTKHLLFRATQEEMCERIINSLTLHQMKVNLKPSTRTYMSSYFHNQSCISIPD